MDQERLKQLIALFLETNPEPSDAQFHAFAASLGVDKETLEAVCYEMLGDEIQHEKDEGDDQQLEELVEGVSTHFPEGIEVEDFGVVQATARLRTTAAEIVEHEGGGQGEVGISEQQEVLQGEGDADTTDTDNLLLTDGAPVGDTTDDEMQDSALNDGAGPGDTGLGINTQKALLLNDGAPALQLESATVRLVASERAELFGIPAAHLSKRSGTIDQLGQIADRKPEKITGISLNGPRGQKKIYFYGSSSLTKKVGTFIKFKGMNGIVDVLGIIDKNGKVKTGQEGPTFDRADKRPYYVFK